jgi:ABC-type transporter Mla subunit MlaD
LRAFWTIAFGLLLALPSCVAARSQDDTAGPMSQAEIESLRDTSYIPVDKIRAFEKMLDDREKLIDDLLKKGRGPDFARDMHDAMDQFGAIADELNDNLDDFNDQHRDVRKALPKLIQEVDRWSTSLRAAGEDDRYNVVRRIALDNLKDTRDIAQDLQSSQEAYFKAHPDAEKLEKQRAGDPHAPE